MNEKIETLSTTLSPLKSAKQPGETGEGKEPSDYTVHDDDVDYNDVMMMMMMLMMIIIIKFYSNNSNKDADNDRIKRRYSRFFLQSCHCAANCLQHSLKWPERNRVQITCNTSGAHHVQHVVCHVVQRDSSAIKFDRVEIAFILAIFYRQKLLTDEGGGGRGGNRRKP